MVLNRLQKIRNLSKKLHYMENMSSIEYNIYNIQ